MKAILYFEPAEREATLKSLIAQWAEENGPIPKNLSLSVYKVAVEGQVTYAIWFPNEHDSIRAYFYVLDSKGKTIDDAAVYGESSVGENGVTWQNESVQK